MRIIRPIVLSLSAMLVLGVLPAQATPLGTGRSSGFDGELDVDSVTRKSGVVTVKSLAKNTGKKSGTVEPCTKSYLLDPEKGIKYEALKDEEGNSIGSGSLYIGEGTTRPVWCKFPAPPAEVKTIGYVHTGFDAIEDLPITDK